MKIGTASDVRGGAPRAGSSDIDASLSSTTPDVTLRRPVGAATWVASGSLIGLTIGALFGRSRASASIGGAAGAVVGATLVVADRALDSASSRIVQMARLERRHQIWFALSRPTQPWLASTGLTVAREARQEQLQLFGSREPLDGPQDAFRHAYAAGLFALRAMRDHGLSPAAAHGLAIGAGEAHERDGQDDNDELSRTMDLFNNEAGTRIVRDGRAKPGEPSTAQGFITEQALQRRVLTAMADGKLQLVDRAAEPPAARASRADDLPSQ